MPSNDSEVGWLLTIAFEMSAGLGREHAFQFAAQCELGKRRSLRPAVLAVLARFACDLAALQFCHTVPGFVPLSLCASDRPSTRVKSRLIVLYLRK